LFNRAMVGAERIAEVLSVQSELADNAAARPAPKLRGAVAFHDLWFEYEPQRPVLQGINLLVAPGEKIAIVGPTGAGKSTLISLILRFYDPTKGMVLADGEDLRDFTLLSLREQISLVLQDSLLFSGTIRENIAFGRPGASDEEIVNAARLANAHEFIVDLP